MYDFDLDHEDDGARPIAGAKSSSGSGKSGGGASVAKDTLYTTATVKLVELIGEGEIVGVRDGLKGIYLNDTPVQNADGTFNVKGITAEFRTGTPDQAYMAGFPDVETPTEVGVKVRHEIPAVVTVANVNANRIRVTLQIPALLLAKSDGTVRENTVAYRVEVRYAGGPWVNQLGDQTIAGKASSPFYPSHEIDLPASPVGASAPWQVRTTRLSPDTDDFNNSQDRFTNQSDLYLQTVTEIADAKLAYPHSALVGLTMDASVFGSSVPRRSYLVDGIRMPIPSNYDPAARTYAGIWDGSFTEGFTSNPAWVLNLILQDDRFGLGQFIDVAAIDKWSLYQIGAYCDQQIPDGFGGTEPRFTFNGCIRDQHDAFELLELVAQVFRGMTYWSSGSVTATQDRPADPVLLVTPANVLDDDGFVYASSARKARHTVAIVAWNDPSDLYKVNYEVVEDPDGIARYGYNPTKVDLLGCTSRGQAHRAGLWTLHTELRETQVLTYKAGLDHAVVRPGDLVAVQDPQIAALDFSGRLLDGSTASHLRLDRSVTLSPGTGYAISVMLPDGAVAERPVATPGGASVSTLDLAAPLPQAPDKAAVWVLVGNVVPQLFRVVSIKETEPHIYEVTALQHEPGKYATIDQGAPFEPLAISEFPKTVASPKNLAVRESQYYDLGVARQALTLSWTVGDALVTSAYIVTAIRPDGALINLPQRGSATADFTDVATGTWTFLVTAVGISGARSPPAQLNYVVTGWQGRPAPTVTGLSIKGGSNQFVGRSCTLVWGHTYPDGQDPFPIQDAVYVYDASSSALLHREVLPAGQAEWTYDYLVNVNEGGPRRQFRVAVAATTPDGREGNQTSLLVSNPPPDRVDPTLTAISEMFFVEYPRPTDPDWDGTLFWVSETSGFNPLVKAPTLDSRLTAESFPGVPERTYYVRVAAYDAFGKNPAELNISVEKAIRVTVLLFDPSAPTLPGQPALTTLAETALDGTVTAVVKATWTASTGNFGGLYYVAFSVAGGGFVEEQVSGAAAWEKHGFPPNVQVQVKVRAASKTGFTASGYGPVATIATAKSTVVPDNPTGATATGTYQGVTVAWTPPAALDLDYVEAWSLDGTSNAVSPPGGATARRVGRGTTIYLDATLAPAAGRTYWLRSVSTSGVTASGFTSPVTATNPQIAAAALATGVIDATKFASSIAVNTVVSTLPTTKTTAFVTLSSDGKQYRWDTSLAAYTKAVPAVDVGPGLTAAQIASVNATAVNGTLTDAQLAGISASKLVGQIVDNQIAALAASKVTGQVTDAQIAAINAAKLSGQITTTQITDSSISTAKLQAASVVASTIAAGAILASKLAIASTNLIPNSNGSMTRQDGIIYGAIPANGAVLSAPRLDNAYGGTSAFLITPPTIPPSAETAQQILFRRTNLTGVSTYYPVAPGVYYEFSAYVSTYDCTGSLYVDWIDASGTNVGRAVTGGQNSGVLLRRQGGIALAPASAAYAAFNAQAVWNGGSNPNLFVSAPMMAQVNNGQTELSPYVDSGVTTITGSSILTGSVGADRIVANSLTTAQVQAGGINADRLVANSITAAQIAAQVITATQIAARTILAVNMVAGTLTSNEIAARTILASNIVSGTLTANEIAVNSITADRLLANSITAAQIAAGAISTAQLAAGAITTDKIGVGLSTGNQVFNSDVLLGFVGYDTGFSNTSGLIMNATPIGDANSPYRMGAIYLSHPGSPSGTYGDIAPMYPLAAGGFEAMRPVLPGKTYEVSAYVNCYRSAGADIAFAVFDGNTNLVADFHGPRVNGVVPGTLAQWPRATLLCTMPASAAYGRPYVRTYYNGGNNPYTFVSGFYLGFGTPNLSQFSEWTPASFTVINGGQVATNSLNANKIVAGSITTDRFTSNTIDANIISTTTFNAKVINVDGLNAANVVVGTARLNSWVSGSDTTRINGGSIAANSITTNSLKVGSRNIQLIGCSFYSERDGNGNLTNVIAWTTGFVLVQADNGAATGYSIPASRVSIDAGYWYIWWNNGGANFGCAKDNWQNILNDSQNVLIATVSALTGISVLVGGTIIDGTRITAYSIQAAQIAANQIQTQHMAANSIQGDRIVAGSLVADKIASGTITAGTITIGSRVFIETYTGVGRIRVVNNENNQNRIVLGELSGFTQGGDFGLLCYDQTGVLQMKVSSTGSYFNGAVIGAATIGTAQIADAVVTSAKIGNLQVGTIKIADGAVSQIVSSSSTGQSTTTSLTSRGTASRFHILAYRRGNSGQRYNVSASNGALYIEYTFNGTDYGSIAAVLNISSYQWDATAQGNYLLMQATALPVTWSPGVAGNITFRVRDDNNQNVGGVYISVTEFAK